MPTPPGAACAAAKADATAKQQVMFNAYTAHLQDPNNDIKEQAFLDARAAYLAAYALEASACGYPPLPFPQA